MVVCDGEGREHPSCSGHDVRVAATFPRGPGVERGELSSTPCGHTPWGTSRSQTFDLELRLRPGRNIEPEFPSKPWDGTFGHYQLIPSR